MTEVNKMFKEVLSVSKKDPEKLLKKLRQGCQELDTAITDHFADKNDYSFVEEIADVQLLINQISEAYCINLELANYRVQKIERTYKRIEAGLL